MNYSQKYSNILRFKIFAFVETRCRQLNSHMFLCAHVSKFVSEILYNVIVHVGYNIQPPRFT